MSQKELYDGPSNKLNPEPAPTVKVGSDYGPLNQAVVNGWMTAQEAENVVLYIEIASRPRYVVDGKDMNW